MVAASRPITSCVIESAVHVEHDQPRVPPPRGIRLQDDVDVPLALEAIDLLVLPQVRERRMPGTARGGERVSSTTSGWWLPVWCGPRHR